jgi:hypothetical protein
MVSPVEITKKDIIFLHFISSLFDRSRKWLTVSRRGLKNYHRYLLEGLNERFLSALATLVYKRLDGRRGVGTKIGKFDAIAVGIMFGPLFKNPNDLSLDRDLR